MRFLFNRRGTATLEWLTVAVIVVAVIGVILWQVFNRLSARYTDVYNDL